MSSGFFCHRVEELLQCLCIPKYKHYNSLALERLLYSYKDRPSLSLLYHQCKIVVLYLLAAHIAQKGNFTSSFNDSVSSM